MDFLTCQLPANTLWHNMPDICLPLTHTTASSTTMVWKITFHNFFNDFWVHVSHFILSLGWTNIIHCTRTEYFKIAKQLIAPTPNCMVLVQQIDIQKIILVHVLVSIYYWFSKTETHTLMAGQNQSLICCHTFFKTNHVYLLAYMTKMESFNIPIRWIGLTQELGDQQIKLRCHTIPE